MTSEQITIVLRSLPQQPGCYRYYSIENELLYVGKAKDLRKRVSSYFNKTVDNYKTRLLVTLIEKIEYTVTDTEHDAFLLENSLIKHHQPRFNINLKDDKSYPFVVIKKEPFSRVFLTRRVIQDGSEYLGPFTSVVRVKELLALIKQNIPLRTCNLNLTAANIAKKKFKVCLEYHLGNCKGPCEGYQSEEEYANNIKQVKHILRGNVGEVVKDLKAEMLQYSVNLEFEKAEIIRQKIDSLLQYESRSTVVNAHMGSMDVVSIISEEHNAYVNYMMINNGSVIYSKSILAEKQLDETEEEILSIVLDRMREEHRSISKEVISSIPLEFTDTDMKLTIPKAGDKKKLLDLSLKNAETYKQELKRKDTLLLGSKEGNMNVLEELQSALQLTELPLHIECFDNSNFQGSYPVAAMVCFRNGLPYKKEYRHFHIKTVEGINDFASMSEIVYRRYKRLMDEGEAMPQLVIIDGGKGQLNAALESIEKLGLTGRMSIVGLAKREESVFFPGDNDPLQLPFDNPAHLLIRRIRDEVHRFGITFHRQTRSKGTIKNELEAIPGIGEKTATELLKTFRSVKNISTLTERELAKAIGMSKARVVYSYFHKTEENT